MSSQVPIDLDRSRNLPVAIAARKPAPMLDLIKMTVFLTVSSRLPSKKAMRDKGLAAQLITEWEKILTPVAIHKLNKSDTENCGTSTAQIERAYYHTTEVKMITNALPQFEYRDGLLVPK